ncbi:MAG: HEPN domain-containing protein [Methanobrevibacter sp.]|jgi:uncharacterized protein (UPF0332 family)|nr:HEPN domain-containing protein [Candidatus Methanovirga basalitermitum]
MDKRIDLAIKKAYESLEVAKLLFDKGYYSDSISRSHYATFHASKALLFKKGVDSKKHSGNIQNFGLEYVVKDDFDNEKAEILSNLEDDRENVDYDFSFKATKEQAEQDLNDAKAFIDECERFL